MPTNRRYRRITSTDNPTTIPNRVTFPVGSYSPTDNPSTAQDGQFGAPYGNQPAFPPPKSANVFPTRLTFGPTTPIPNVPKLNPLGQPIGQPANVHTPLPPKYNEQQMGRYDAAKAKAKQIQDTFIGEGTPPSFQDYTRLEQIANGTLDMASLPLADP